MRNATEVSQLGSRYDSLRDSSGEWTFDITDYQTDLNALSPVDVSSEPRPREAYSAAVFLEGFIESHKNDGNWSDAALDEFESFESTLEAEAVARALRELATDAVDQPGSDDR